MSDSGDSVPAGGVHLLPHQELIISDLNREDHMCLLASGLGWQTIIAVLLRAHASTGCSGGIVVILGANAWQKQLLIKELVRHQEDSHLPLDITSEVLAGERVKHYQQGKSCFVTTRIFVVDLLSKRVAAETIKGIVVLNAHRVKDASGEGFAVRIYRETNKTGFIRALSDQPMSFSAGFSKAERVMKALHIRRLSLWPRFHSVVRDDLEKFPIEVMEICEELTKSMAIIQNAIMATMAALIEELKSTNKFESSELSIENGMFESFDEIVQRHINPIWRAVSWKTKQIIEDLRQLRKLSSYLLHYDCVTFLRFLENLKAVGARSVWLFHEASHTIFEEAKRRVYRICSTNISSGSDDHKKIKGAKNSHSPNHAPCHQIHVKDRASSLPSPASTGGSPGLKPVLEQLPKWRALRDVLVEIQDTRDSTPGKQTHDNHQSTTLVICKEQHMCKQLNNVLADGAGFMRRKFDGYLSARHQDKKIKQKDRSGLSRRTKNGQQDKHKCGDGASDPGDKIMPDDSQDPKILSLDLLEDERKKRKRQNRSAPQLAEFEEIIQEDLEVFEIETKENPLLQGVTFLSLDSHNTFLLWETNPEFVIMYDLDVSFLRQLELFKAEDPNRSLRLYLLSYKGSLEQHKYKLAIQKEIKVFTDLIENKQRITIPLDLDDPLRNTNCSLSVASDIGQVGSVAGNSITRRYAIQRRNMSELASSASLSQTAF